MQAATFAPTAALTRMIAWMERGVLGLPVCASRRGHEIVNGGGNDELPGYLSWEGRQLPHHVTCEYGEVAEMRAWLAAEATRDWSCTMPETGIGVAYSVPPGRQTFRFASEADAKALVARFPSARPVRS